MNFHFLQEHAVFFRAAELKEMRVSRRETEIPQLRNEHSQIQESECRNRFISLKSILSFCWLKVLSAFCTRLRRCAGVGSVCCICEWQKVSKLALLPVGWKGELQKSLGYQQLLIKSLEMLETVFDSSM